MYHQMSCWRSGKYQDLVEDREEMDWLNKKNEEYVIDRTNLTKDDIKEIREKRKISIFILMKQSNMELSMKFCRCS